MAGLCRVPALVAALALVSAVAGTQEVGGAAPAVRPLTPQFAWLVPTAAPAGWRHVELPSGAALLSFPPFLRREKSDAGSITAVERNAQGLTPIYVNATPREGNEELATWPAFRLAILRDESARTVHEGGRVVDAPFLGGVGSCVLDDYVTRIGDHHYVEIACYVVGRHGGSVLVASTFASLWPKEKQLLEQIVAGYLAT